MNNLRQPVITSSAEDVKDKASKRTAEASTLHGRRIDKTIIENNPKVDHQLLSEFYRVTEEYERLVAAAKGVIRVTQGADYNLAHPLASKDKPTDAYHRGQRVSTDKKR